MIRNKLIQRLKDLDHYMNAPAIFMNLMNIVLVPYLDQFMVVFIDDILAYSKPGKVHEKHLRIVFRL